MAVRKRALLALLAGLAASTPSLAGTARYYYDPAGRLLGETQTDDPDRITQTDYADNLTFLHVLPYVAPTSASTLGGNGLLVADQSLTSPDGRFALVVQDDGNLVIYQNSNGSALWSSGTNGNLPGFLVMQGDGNLVFYGPSNVSIWNSGTSGHANVVLSMQSDGNLVLYSGSTAIWSTNTGGH